MRTIALLCMMALFCCCNEQSPVFTPATGHGTDYPCGVNRVVCGDAPPATNCCEQYSRCVKDGCEFMGDPNTIPDWTPTTFGARKSMPRMSEVDAGH